MSVIKKHVNNKVYIFTILDPFFSSFYMIVNKSQD